jgi:hypothetical protein
MVYYNQKETKHPRRSALIDKQVGVRMELDKDPPLRNKPLSPDQKLKKIQKSS